MKALLLFECLLPVLCWAQSNFLPAPLEQRRNPSGCARVCDLQVARGNDTVAELAEQDIQAQTPYLIVFSGEGFGKLTRTHLAFEQRFKVQYYQVGCLVRSVDDAITYNECIFDYLQATYGKDWQRKVWASVAGWEEWKQAHK